MRYAAIYPFDISNGPGIRVSLFVQGCDKHCPGCFNQEAGDFNGGKQFDEKTISELLRLAENEGISGLSILGGEPLHPYNIQGVVELCTRFKEKYPNKSIGIGTGYTGEVLCERYLNKTISKEDSIEVRELLFGDAVTDRNGVCDCVVDGPFIEAKKNLSLKWRGSSNQRIGMKGGTGKMDQNPNEGYCIE